VANIVRARGWGQVKPPPGAQIEWGHPLAQELRTCVLLNDESGGSSYDLVRGRSYPWSIVAGSPKRVPGGIDLNGGSSEGAGDPVFSPAIDRLDDKAFSCDGLIFLTGDTSGVAIAVETTSSAPSGNNLTSGIGLGVGSGTLDSPGGTLISVNNWVAWQSTAVSVPKHQWVHIGFTRQGTTTRVYMNGRQVHTWTQALAAFGLAPTIAPIGHTVDLDSPTRVFGERIGFSRSWSRALTSTEFAQLAAEPFAFFAPPAPKIFYIGFDGAGGGASTTTTSTSIFTNVPTYHLGKHRMGVRTDGILIR